jgi:hypothetical protein
MNKDKPRMWAWWHMLAIPVFGRLRQDDQEFQASLGYLIRTCLKKRRKKSMELHKIHSDYINSM